MIDIIEHKAGIKFKKTGLPDHQELVKSSAKEVTSSLQDVDEKVLELFKVSATQLILDKGALAAVSLALANLSGATKKLQTRSLINGETGYVTMQIQTESDTFDMTEAVGIMSRIVPNFSDKPVRNITMLADNSGCIFDVPQGMHEEVLENASKIEDECDVTVPSQLPETQNRGMRGSYRNEGGYNSRGRQRRDRSDGFNSGHRSFDRNPGRRSNRSFDGGYDRSFDRDADRGSDRGSDRGYKKSYNRNYDRRDKSDDEDDSFFTKF